MVLHTTSDSNFNYLPQYGPGLSLGEGRGRLGGRGLLVLLGLPPPVQAVLALQAPDVGVKVWLRSEVT